jgi:ABC-type transport system substrate-binding protein
MKPCNLRTSIPCLLLLALVVPIIAACGGPAAPAQVVRETVPPVVITAPPVKETVVVRETVVAPTAEAAPAGTAEPSAGAFTTPHPILGDVRVRQAIAYCTNRPELIKSVYPFLNEDEQKKLLMDTNLPQGHWALATEGITKYPFDPEKGKALLDEAGWKEPEGGGTREKEGVPLFIKFTTTDAQFRQTWAAVFEQQLADNCGIQISRTHAPASWWFGDTTGLARRDFELGGYAWVGEADPGGTTLYACNQIPLPTNQWEGQNAMGWCNETASKAILAANNTLDREERKKQYAIFQQEFTKDMVSLPLFNRLEAAAANLNLVNFKPNPTEYITANADQWELKDGGDTLVLGFTQEPASLFQVVEQAAAARMVGQLLSFRETTQYDYDYQAVGFKTLPTVDSGLASVAEVDVKEGDKVWTAAGEAATLAAGVEVTNSAGQSVEYAGSPLKLNQMKVTFQYADGLKWEDGEPVKKADFELAYKINCDPESGATTFQLCNSIQKVDFTSDTEYTITYLPGVLWPEYFIQTVGVDEKAMPAYPSHQVLSDGRKLADVPAKEWATLPEIAEKPLSNGPYKLVEWQKGQRMTLEANENYFKGAPKIKKIIIQFVEDTNQAVAQLLTGDIDLLDPTTLGAGPEVETVLKAAAENKIQAVTIASPTWEHIDMNLFTK